MKSKKRRQNLAKRYLIFPIILWGLASSSYAGVVNHQVQFTQAGSAYSVNPANGIGQVLNGKLRWEILLYFAPPGDARSLLIEMDDDSIQFKFISPLNNDFTMPNGVTFTLNDLDPDPVDFQWHYLDTDSLFGVTGLSNDDISGGSISIDLSGVTFKKNNAVFAILAPEPSTFLYALTFLSCAIITKLIKPSKINA